MNYNNPDVYKRTRKKKGYAVTVEMPPLGTTVFNRLEKAQYCTDINRRFVITGTVGEQWVIDLSKLARTYTFRDGVPISEATLQSMVTYDPVTQCEIIKPFKVFSSSSDVCWAAHVPNNIQFQVPTAWGDTLLVNAMGVEHGIGDFLVCADAGGKPNLADRWVVNGLVFKTTYDMRGVKGLH